MTINDNQQQESNNSIINVHLSGLVSINVKFDKIKTGSDNKKLEKQKTKITDKIDDIKTSMKRIKGNTNYNITD